MVVSLNLLGCLYLLQYRPYEQRKMNIAEAANETCNLFISCFFMN